MKKITGIEIKDRKYTFRMLPGEKGFDVSLKVIASFGKSLVEFMSLAESKPAGEDLGVSDIVGYVGRILPTLDPIKIKEITTDMLPTIFVLDEKSPSGRLVKMDDFAGGKTGDLYIVTALAIWHNFADFFADGLLSGMKLMEAKDV